MRGKERSEGKKGKKLLEKREVRRKKKLGKN